MVQKMSLIDNISIKSEKKWPGKFTYSFKEYKGYVGTIAVITCKYHGRFENTLHNHFKSIHGCNQCANESSAKKLKLSNEEFIRKAVAVHGNKYDYSLVVYKNDRTRVKIKCKKHKEIFLQSPHKHLSGQSCPKCAMEKQSADRMYSKEEYILSCKKAHPANAYDYSNANYIGSKKHIDLKCNKCSGTFSVLAVNHRKGQGCPKCASSKGESAIMSFLDEYNISYEKEKSFPNLKDKGLLRYDFFIPTMNILIEFDGIQHYKPIKFNGMDEEKALQKHKEVIKRDNLKNKYAIENGFLLKRIGYKQIENVDIILKKLFF